MFVRSSLRRGLAGSVAALSATVLSGLALTAATSSTAEAKVPGKTYCYKRVCHRVHTIAEMVALVGRDESLTTSHYDDCKRDRFNPCGLTSSGEKFRADKPDNAASPIYPNGTVLLIRNPANGNAAVVRVNNSGPYWGKRKLDVSRATAEKLGFKKRGVAKLDVRVVSVPTRDEARYKKNRNYPAVPGPIGQFASLDQAQGGMMMAMALDAMSGSVFAPAAGKMLGGLKTAKPAVAKVLLRGSTTVVASADSLPASSLSQAARDASGLTPAEGLKAAARRVYGHDDAPKIVVPSSLTAEAGDVPAILRARQTVPRG
jgi:rare lipoprotein A